MLGLDIVEGRSIERRRDDRQDLRLEPAAEGYGMARLSDEIMRTMRRAQTQLARQVADIADRTVGVDSATGRAVIAGFETRFPAREEDGD